MADDLKAILLPFAQAYFRLEYHNSNNLNLPLMVAGDSLYELLASVSKESLEPTVSDYTEQDVLLNVGHLKTIFDYCKEQGWLEGDPD